MSPIKSMVGVIVGALADRLAADPRIPADQRQAFRASAAVVIECELSRLFGGEQLRLHVPKIGAETRRARDERIAAAIQRGESPASVARRESVSERHARRVRGRIGGHKTP